MERLLDWHHTETTELASSFSMGRFSRHCKRKHTRTFCVTEFPSGNLPATKVRNPLGTHGVIFISKTDESWPDQVWTRSPASNLEQSLKVSEAHDKGILTAWTSASRNTHAEANAPAPCRPLPQSTVLQKGSSCGRGRKLPNNCFPIFQRQILRSDAVQRTAAQGNLCLVPAVAFDGTSSRLAGALPRWTDLKPATPESTSACATRMTVRQQ